MAEIYQKAFIALRCPLCGKIEYHPLSPFTIKADQPHRIHCSCGFRKAMVMRGAPNNFQIQIPCISCGREHAYTYSARTIWRIAAGTMACPIFGETLGFLGERDEVEEAGRQWKDGGTEGLSDYFLNPSVVFDILEHLQDLAGTHSLYCQCGSMAIELDLRPEYLELHCVECGMTARIQAVTDEDRMEIVSMDEYMIEDEDSQGPHELAPPTLYRLK